MNTLTDLSDVIDGTADGFYFAEIGEEYSEEDKARFIMEQLQYVTDYKFPIEMPEYKKEVAFHVFGGLQQLFGAGKIVVHMPDVTTMSDQTVSAEDKKLLGWIEFESYLYDLKFKTPDEVLDAHSVEIIGGVEFATKEWGELAELVNLINKEAEKIN